MGKVLINNDASKLVWFYHRLNTLQIKIKLPIILVFGTSITLIVQFVHIKFVSIANEHYFRKQFWKMVETIESI